MRGLDPRRLLWVLAWLAVAAIAVLTLVGSEIADPDLWGEIAMGRETLRRGWPPTRDDFAYVPTKNPVVYHEWLSGVLFYSLLGGLGSPALKGLTLLTGLATVTAAAVAARRLGASGLSLLVVLMIALPALQQGYSVIRAQVFTFLFFSLFIFLLERAEQGHSRALLIIPLVMIVWANLHGGFVAGIGLLLLYTISRLARGERSGMLAGITLVAVAVTLINPYGLAYWHYLREALLMPRPRVWEWRAVPWDLVSRWEFKALLLLSTLTLIVAPVRHWTAIVVMAVTAFLGARHLRHIPLFCVAAIAFLPVHLSPLLDRMVGRLRVRVAARPILSTLVAAFMLLSLLGVAVFQLVRFTPWRLQVPASYYPVGAVDFLQVNDLRGNLATPFNWGEYVLWKLHPKVKVSFDGRYETVYSPEVAADSFNFAHGEGDWRRLLREYPTQMVLVDKRYRAAWLMEEEPGWSVAYEDAISRLYLPADRSKGPWRYPPGADGTIP
jgi:hypothetical protein